MCLQVLEQAPQLRVVEGACRLFLEVLGDSRPAVIARLTAAGRLGLDHVGVDRIKQRACNLLQVTAGELSHLGPVLRLHIAG